MTQALLESLSITFTSNGKREFVPRDQVSPLLVVHCSLFLDMNQQFHAIFIHKKCFELFLSAHFLFSEIVNLNLTFAVCRIRESYLCIMYDRYTSPVDWLKLMIPLFLLGVGVERKLRMGSWDRRIVLKTLGYLLN